MEVDMSIRENKTQKKCSKCGEIKDISSFYRHKRSLDGYDPRCKDCSRIYSKEYRKKQAKHLTICKSLYRQLNVEKIREYRKKYRSKNYSKTQDYLKTRKDKDPLFKLHLSLGSLIRTSLKKKGYTKRSRTHELLGADYETVMAHLGPKPEGDYQLDHICCCAQAKNEEELIKLQNYNNLQWLPAKDNRNKAAKRTPEGEELCRQLLGREWED
jgi:hypothetical protein